MAAAISPGKAAAGGASAVNTSAWPAVVIALVTGATMLGGQVAWMRLAQVQVGSGLLAGALSLAGAMAGLAIGAGISARRLVRRPIGAVALWQQGLSAVALLASPWAIAGVGSAAFALVRGRMDLAAAQWVLAAAVGLLLAILNVPFGMLLPVAVELDLPHRERHPSRRGGLFYAFQSAGAVAGAVLLGLALPAMLGYRTTLALAAIAHLLLLLWLVRLSRRWPALREPPPVQDRTPQRRGADSSAPPRRSVMWLAFWLGMLGLAGELVWLRGLVFYLHSNVYVYGLTAAVFIGALTLGGLAGAWLSPLRRRPGQFLAAVVLLIGLFVAASGQWLGYLPGLLGQADGELLGSAGFFGLIGQMLAIAWAVAVVVAPPAALMGVAFPLLLRLAGPPTSVEGGTRDRSAVPWPGAGQVGRIVGRVAAWNALGSVLGPLVGFGVLLTLLDERRSLLAIAVGYMIAALWAEIIDPATGWHRSRARAARPGAGGTRFVGSAGDPGHDEAWPSSVRTRRQRLQQATRRRIPWLNMVLFAGAAGVCLWQADRGPVFRPDYLRATVTEFDSQGRPRSAVRLLDEDAETQTVSLKLIESREAVVAVRRRTDDGVAELMIDRQVQGDDSPLALRVQRHQGLLPLVLAPKDRPRRALVIGLGTGCSVAPLVEAGVGEVTVAELIGPVIKFALGEFADANDSLFLKKVRQFEPAPQADQATTQPAASAPAGGRDSQVRILQADGRTLLRFEPPGWDLILVDIIYPTAPGAADLFSEQFYRLAYQRLGEDGLFVHWLPLWQLRPEDAASVVAAFQHGFGPRDGGRAQAATRLGTLLCLPLNGRAMGGLIGARRPLDLTPDRLADRIEKLHETVDRKAGRLPKLADVNLADPREIWAGLLTEPLLARWADDARPNIDWFPRTELRTPLGAEAGFTRGNVARLLACGYAGKDYVDRLAGAIDAGADFDRNAMVRRLSSRHSLAEACQLGSSPGNTDAVHGRLAQAVQADRDDALAVFQLEAFQYDMKVASAGRMGSPGQALAALDKIDDEFPHALDALKWKVYLLVREADRLEDPADASKRLLQAVEATDEMMARAPRSADVHYRKAQLLEQVARKQLKAGDVARARRSADEAQIALTGAARLRSDVPREYRRLARDLAALVEQAKAQPTTAAE